jgi:DNA-binding transcriptional MerR regulator
MIAFTLTQAARALGVAQHKLIHLCEKKVVVPDVRDARGRGSSRKFSKRNLFDFAVALEMRRLELPVSFVHAVLRVLGTFELEAKKMLRGFALPESLLAAGGPRLALIILDGERVYFSVATAGHHDRAFGGIAIHPAARGRAQHRSAGRLQQAEMANALAAARARVELDLSRIARDLEEQLEARSSS